jgi:TatD DNase family protein
LIEYIDTHCHLDLDVFDDDRDEVIERAINTGVGYFINPGIDLVSSQKIIQLSAKYPQIFPVIGLHPNDLGENWADDFLSITDLCSYSRVCAIGEIGLDMYHKDVPLALQMESVDAQLDLANQQDLPVIIHCREALDIIFPILRTFSEKRRESTHTKYIGVMHNFEGDGNDAQRFIELGFMIGLGGPVTYKNAHTKHHLAETIPLENLLLETDSPFLTPVPYRGCRNEPAYIPQIGKRTAIIRGCSEEIIQAQTTQNAILLFRLGVDK